MKLQDKETNEIIEIEVRQVNDKNLEDRTLTTIDGEGITLEKLSKKYVDYEEPIEFWTIDIMRMNVAHIYGQGKFRIVSDEQIANLEELGLKFKTEEEAEQAIEKMKALTRLREKGFKFTGFSGGRTIIEFTFDKPGEPGSAYNDLDLLFGGEDE